MIVRVLALLLALPVALSPAAWAQGDELRRLREALAALQQEQQAVYQQFQMVQGLRAAQSPPLAQGSAPVYTPPATPPNYEDLVRERDRYAARQTAYQDELQRLYDRYRELESRKQPLLDRITELGAAAR
jgi:hypothetical protein